MTLRRGDTEIPVEADGAFVHEVALAPGENRLALVALDAAGNRGDWSATVRHEPLPDGLTEGAEPGVFVWTADIAAMVRLDGPDGRDVAAFGAVSMTYDCLLPWVPDSR